MKALVLKRYCGLDQIAFADIPRPALKPDEILVQVHAAGLNPIDCMIPKGTFKPSSSSRRPAPALAMSALLCAFLAVQMIPACAATTKAATLRGKMSLLTVPALIPRVSAAANPSRHAT